MGFASASLSIGKKSGIISLKDRFYKMSCSFVDFLLLSWIVHMIEPKYFFLIVLTFYIDRRGVALNLNGGYFKYILHICFSIALQILFDFGTYSYYYCKFLFVFAFHQFIISLKFIKLLPYLIYIALLKKSYS